jgi:aminocarboxymuconate-semialdehyde decarboxylase
VLSTVPVMFNYQAKPEDTLQLSRFLNDHIASICRKAPHRFIGTTSKPLAPSNLSSCLYILHYTTLVLISTTFLLVW